jgi:PAS domain S-box-containing protein
MSHSGFPVNKLRDFIEGLPDLAWLSQPDGEVELCNKLWHDYTGCGHGGLTSDTWTSTIHSEDQNTLRTLWLSSDPFKRGAIRIRRCDGEYKWFAVHAAAIRDDRGAMKWWYVTASELDSHNNTRSSSPTAKRSDEFGKIAADTIEEPRFQAISRSDTNDINTSNRQLREIFNSIPTQVWVAIDAYTTVFQNQPYLDYLGLAAEQTNGSGWRDAVHPDDADAYFNRWVEIAASGRGGQAEARFRRHDGEYRWFLMQVEPLRDSEGNIIRWYGANTDIEDLKRGNEALKNAQLDLARAVRLTTLGEFATSMAHEINQPLAAIVTNAAAALRWLSKDSPDILEVRLAAERIVENGRRAGDIIKGIRGLAKKGSSEVIEFRINEAITEILSLIQDDLRASNVTLELRLSDDTGSITGNRVQLQQVILNLVRNGIEAMHALEPGRRILRIVSQDHGGGGVMIVITDQGEGISQENTDRVFEAFFTTKPEGTGMGLSICRTIVEAHGGRLWTSPNDPCGSTFCFSLPRARMTPRIM